MLVSLSNRVLYFWTIEFWRGGRVAKGTGLLNLRRGNSTEGSNPFPSDISHISTISIQKNLTLTQPDLRFVCP